MANMSRSSDELLPIGLSIGNNAKLNFYSLALSMRVGGSGGIAK